MKKGKGHIPEIHQWRKVESRTHVPKLGFGTERNEVMVLHIFGLGLKGNCKNGFKSTRNRLCLRKGQMVV